jgi:hypothetical protein
MDNSKYTKLKKIILKCKEDPVFFIKNFVKIKHPKKGIILFELFPYQEELIRETLSNEHIVINKGRQLGVSTLFAALCLWEAMFYKSKNILAIATKNKVAKNFIEKCKFAYKELPEELRDANPLEIDNTQEIKFARTQSVIQAIGTSKDAGRSEALSRLIIDEAAFIRDMPIIWEAIYPTLSEGGNCAMFSTPNKTGNIFHTICMEAKNGENDFLYKELKWDVHPNRDQAWKEKTLRQLGSIERFLQEYDCSFEASGDLFIPRSTMVRLKEQLCPPRCDWELGARMHRWEDPMSDVNYAIGCDVARGDGKDYSTIQVIRSDTGQQVAEYKAKVDTTEFAGICVDVGRFWNNAALGIERNNLGWSVLTTIRDNLPYPNLFFQDRNGRPHLLDAYTGFNETGLKPGFDMQHGSRIAVLDNMSEYLSKGVIGVKSERLIDELNTFVWKNGRVDHEDGKNDDLIIGFAIAIWIIDKCLGTHGYFDEMTASMIEGISKISTSIDELGHGISSSQADEMFGIHMSSGIGNMANAPMMRDNVRSGGAFIQGNVRDPFYGW